MQKDKIKMNKRLGLMRTIENKRTISSEQGHYQHSHYNRKFTLENCEVKRNSKQLNMPRKNHSLPRTLTTIQQNVNTNAQKSMRSRKFMASSSQLSYNDSKLGRAGEADTFSLEKYDETKGSNFAQLLKEGIAQFEAENYKQAITYFLKILQALGEKSEEAVYFLGVCQLHLGETDSAVLHLMKCLRNNFPIAEDVLRTLSQIFERTKNYISALTTLDAWAKTKPSPHCFLMRARIHYHFKDYEKAISDYGQCYRLDHSRLQAYIEEAEATYHLKGIEEGLKKYNNLLVNYKSLWPDCEYSDINYVKYRKGLLLLHEKKYRAALDLLKQVNNSQLQSETNYYIGTVHGMLGSFEEATISFCKSIQAKTSNKFVAQSYYEKFVLMFKKSQFYAIQHELDLLRLQEEEEMLHLKPQEEAKSPKQRNSGRLSAGFEISNSQSLRMMKKLVEGLIYILKMNFADGIQTLGELQENKYYLRHEKMFRVTVISFRVFGYYSLHQFEEALVEISSLQGRRMSQSNLYNKAMLQAIVFCNKEEFNNSLKCLDEAENIEPFNSHTWAIKAVVETIFYRSLVKLNKKSLPSELPSQRKNNKKSLSGSSRGESNSPAFDEGSQRELSATEMNEEILYSAEELINRCLLKEPENDQLLYLLTVISYELGQYQAGLKMIRRAIEASDDHTIKHYYLKANLKVMLDLHAEAINDYSNAIMVMNEAAPEEEETTEKQDPIPECYLERAKCYILTGSKDKAEADLRLFFSTIENVRAYRDELDLFMWVGASNVIVEIYKTILEEEYEPWGKMKCYYLSKELNSCLLTMNYLLNEGADRWGQELSKEDKLLRMQRLNVDRKCLGALKKSSQGSKLFLCEALGVFEEVNQKHQEGDIFTSADIIFFAGVLSFHVGEYSKAKNYFIDSKGEKLLKNELEPTLDSEDIDELFDNRTFTLEEINYNIGICDFVQGKWSGYLDEFPEFKKYHQGVTEEIVNAEEITPFPIKNRLCSIYAPEQSGSTLFRLSFCLPQMKLTEVRFQKNRKILEDVSFKDLDMRPSAPWIQKSKQGIIFTGEVMKESVDLKSERTQPRNAKRTDHRYKNVQG